MKNTVKNKTILFAVLLTGATFLLSNCSSTGRDRSEKASVSMAQVEKDIQAAMLQVDATNKALQELVEPGQSNVNKAFSRYSDQAEKMEEQGQVMLEHSDEMTAKGKDYFDEWRTEGNAYANPKIQSLSEQRRSDLSAVFADISTASVGIKGSFKTYLSDIREINTYLSNDLTPKGVESITPIAQQAITDGDNLKAAITPVLRAIGTAKIELASGGAN